MVSIVEGVDDGDDEDEGSPLRNGVNREKAGFSPVCRENRKVSGSPPGKLTSIFLNHSFITLKIRMKLIRRTYLHHPSRGLKQIYFT
jgi:hypothetical protein